MRRGSSRSSRSSLEKPPRVSWKLGTGKQYAAFLSHYKMEAGMEARYLRDLLQKMLKQPCFLDSQNLINLKDLFGNGLQRSDVLVLLATKNVLRRPYCLLELWVAQRTGVPIVILDTSGQKEISWAEVKHVLGNIENALDEPAVRLIESTLRSIVAEIGTEGEEPPALSQFGEDIALALRMEDRVSATFHPWGTDSEILAAVSELVDMMCLSVGAAAPQLARTHLLSKRELKALVLAKSAARDAVELSERAVELSERAPQALKHHLLTGVGMARHALKRDGSTGACVRRELMASPSHGEPSSHAAALCISCRRGNTAALESALFLQEVASLSFEHRLAALRHRRVMFRRLAACRRSPHCCAGVFCSSLKTSSRPGRTSGMTAGRDGLTWGSSMRAQNTPAGFTWARRSTCCCAPEGAAAGPAARGRPSRG